MRVLHVAPEVAPVLHTGGVSEGIAALAAAEVRLGLDVTVAIPRLPRLEPPWASPPVRCAEYTYTRRGGGLEVVTVESAELPRGEERVGLLLVGSPELAAREDVYGEDARDLGSADRVGLFARAVVDLVAREADRGAPFDVVHAHEWPAAPIPYLLRERGGAWPRTVLTIHNLMHQGVFPLDALASLGLGPEHGTVDRLEFYGHASFLKAGILAADAITTVSPRYAQEILGPEQGELLEGVLATRRDRLFGVVNGIDTRLWDPRTDPHLPSRFSEEDMSGKASCRERVLGELGLDPARPLVLSLGRVIEQKGSDVLAAAIPAIVDGGANVVVAGRGDAALEGLLAAAAALRPGRAAYVGFVADPLAHRLVAGSDVLVMPSRYEPCGIVQLYAQRYGVVPVVRRTGGLVDTVLDARVDSSGTGFLFDALDAGALAVTVAAALEALASPAGDELRRRAARRAVGWDFPAARYLAIYRDVGGPR